MFNRVNCTGWSSNIYCCFLSAFFCLFQSHPQLAVKLRFQNQSRDSLDQLAAEFAAEHDLENQGQVGELLGHYLFTPISRTHVEQRNNHLLRRIRSHPSVEYYAPQVNLVRDKRHIVRTKSENDNGIKSGVYTVFTVLYSTVCFTFFILYKLYSTRVCGIFGRPFQTITILSPV